jgi:hypothetical protein
MLLLSNIAQIIRETLLQTSTLEAARLNPAFFTRERKMTFSEIVLFVLSGFKTSTQTALNRFFVQVLKEEKPMSQQALSKARSHFDHSPFELIFRKVVQMRFCGEHDITLLHGFQILAVDGSHIALPDTAQLLEAFGGVGRNADSPTAKISLLYDVMNDFIVDAAIDRAGTSERDFALKHMETLRNICPDLKKLLIFDRGYPSAALIHEIEKQGLYFLMRVRSKWNRGVDEAGMGDSLINIDEETTLRVVKFKLPSGETETLITNLLDMPLKEFPDLYFKRWPIETKYDVLKNKLYSKRSQMAG